MRIASLVPSGTEALFALGFGDDVVAVTHECDWPAATAGLPHLTRSVLPAGLPAAEVDARVRELTAAGEAIYALDEDLLARLAPDLIVTQAVCPVCAVSYEEVCATAARLPSGPRVLSLDPSDLEDVLADLPRLAEACGERRRGDALRAGLRDRLDRVERSVAGLPRPAVVALEWLDPPYAAGHWVPDMVRVAGGSDVLARPGERSRTLAWEELHRTPADLVAVMPCGLDAEASREAALVSRELAALPARRVVAVDAAASFSRPGPRLVEGVELLAHLLHPEAVPAPAGLGWSELTPVRGA